MPMKETTIRNLQALLAAYEKSAGALSAATIAKRATGSDLFFVKLGDPDSRVTLDACDRMEKWFVDNWPADAVWPEGVERPVQAG